MPLWLAWTRNWKITSSILWDCSILDSIKRSKCGPIHDQSLPSSLRTVSNSGRSQKIGRFETVFDQPSFSRRSLCLPKVRSRVSCNAEQLATETVFDWSWTGRRSQNAKLFEGHVSDLKWPKCLTLTPYIHRREEVWS